MSAISQIASKLLSGGSRKGAGTGGGASAPRGRTTPGGTTGGAGGSDAAVGRAVKGVLGKLRR